MRHPIDAWRPRPLAERRSMSDSEFEQMIAALGTGALDMLCPAEVYRPSTKPYRGLPDIEYPFHDRDALVTACGRICMHRKKINISTALARQKLGIKEVEDGI